MATTEDEKVMLSLHSCC